jgi:hypothetical protein
MKSLFWLLSFSALALLTGCIPVPVDLLSKADTSRPLNPPAESVAPAAPAGVTVQSTPDSDVTAAAAPAKSPKPGRLWVVVKSLQIKSYGIDSDVSAEWEVVQGSPEPGARYVLRVSDGDDLSPIEHYVDFDVNLSQGSGQVSEGVRGAVFGVRGGLHAVVGKHRGLGRDELDLVSAKARPGGQSEATPPPTVVEAAGFDAQGKAIALANPRTEARRIGSPRGGWAVDYEVQGDLFPGEQYDWVVEDASGDRVVFNVTTELTFPAHQTKRGTFSGSPIGISRLGGQLKMYIERKGIGIGPRSSGEVVSNTVTLN